MKLQMDATKVVKVSLHELDQLQKIGRQTFAETFSTANSEENMHAYLDQGFSAEKLAAELSDFNTPVLIKVKANFTAFANEGRAIIIMANTDKGFDVIMEVEKVISDSYEMEIWQ